MVKQSKFTAISIALVLAASTQALAEVPDYNHTIIDLVLTGLLANWNQIIIVSESELNGSLLAIEPKALTICQKTGDEQGINHLFPRKGIFI